MKNRKKFLSLLMAVLMFGSIMMPVSQAAQTIYFTSVNDTILNLSDETMPFWSGGALYIPHTAIDNGTPTKELGIYCSYNKTKKIVTLYKEKKVLVFDLVKKIAYDDDEKDKPVGGKAIIRNDIAFLPIETVSKFFGLDYSYLKVTYGHLVRIKSETAVLSDSSFIDAATAPMENRYNQYQRTHPNSGNDSDAPNNNEHSTGTPVYLAIAVSGSDAAEQALTVVSAAGGKATFLFDMAALLSADGDLLRHIVISGSAAALRVDASKGAQQAIAEIERANDILWTVNNTKTRLVYLEHATDGVRTAVREAGYCPISFALSDQEKLGSPSKAATSIIAQAEKRETCSVFLGEAEEAQNTLASLAASLRESGCTLMQLNEVVV